MSFTTGNISSISRRLVTTSPSLSSFLLSTMMSTTMAEGGGGSSAGHSSSPSLSSTDIYQDMTTIMSSSPTMQPPQKSGDNPLSVPYAASEGIVSLLAIFGNALVVYVFCTNRGLRRYRNYYIFALAIADFLVGLLGIPFAVLSRFGLPRNLYGCLFTVSILMVLCTISILCLVAVSIDRYWATTNPFAYYRHMTTSTAVGIILSCWIVGAVIGFLPLFGWYNSYNGSCVFREVMDYNYLVFLYFATIVFPAILMGCFYGYIYHVVLIKIRQKGNLAPQMRRPSEQSRSGSLNSDNRGASQIQRIVVSEKRREAKAAHKLGIIVLFFMICWMPLYTINCISYFFPDYKFADAVFDCTVILSHANSSLNPLLYAYHLKEFRSAMKNALLKLFNKLCCGLMGDRLSKEGGGGPLSRCHTLPSITPTTAANMATCTSAGGKLSKFRRSSPTNNQRSIPIQISSRQGLSILNSSRLDPNNLNMLTTTTNTTTEKSTTSLSFGSEDNISSSVAIQDEFQTQVSSSPNVEDADLLYSSLITVLERKKANNCVDQEDQQDSNTNIISHGIEIHVINMDPIVETGEDVTATTTKVGGNQWESQKKVVVSPSTEMELNEEDADVGGGGAADETINELGSNSVNSLESGNIQMTTPL